MGFRRLTETFLEICVVATVVVSVMLGGSGWGVIAGAIAALAVLSLVRALVVGKLSLAWSRVLPAGAVVVVLVSLQLIPMPIWLLKLVSPQTASLAGELGHTVGRVPISLDRYATKGGLLKLFSALTFFALLLATLRRRSIIKVMLASIVAAAFGAGLLGVLQGARDDYQKPFLMRDMQGPNSPWINGTLAPIESAGYGYVTSHETAGSVHWLHVEPVVGDVFGPFVSSNHFAALAAVGVTLAYGFVLVMAGRLAGRARGHRRLASSPSGNILCLCVLVAGGLLWMLWCAGARGGLLASFFGMVLVTVLAYVKGSLRLRTATVVIALLVVGVAGTALLMLGWPDLTIGQAAAFLGGEIQPRLDIWKGALARGSWWPFGMGLGTFTSLHVPFGESQRIALFAHSEPVQWFVEMGVLGTIAGGAFVVGLALALAGGLRASRASEESLLLCMIAGGLAALAVTSAIDYPLHVYPIALMGVALAACGLALRTHVAAGLDTEVAGEGIAPLRLRGYTVIPGRLRIAGMLVVVAGILAGHSLIIYRCAQAEGLARPIRRVLASNSERAAVGKSSLEMSRYATEALTRALRSMSLEPWAARPSYEVAELFMLAGQNAGRRVGPPVAAYREDALIRAKAALARASERNRLDRLPAVSACLAESLEYSAEKRLAAFEERLPTFRELGLVYWIAAELAGEAGAPSEAARYSARAITMQKDLLPRVLARLRAGALGDLDAFVAGLPDDGPLLAVVGAGIEGFAPRAVVNEINRRAYDAALAALQDALPTSTLHLTAARLAVRLDKGEAAIAHYQSYIAFHEGDAQARFELAQALFDGKEYARAGRELQKMLRLLPQHDLARVLEKRLEPFLPEGRH